LPEKAPTPRRRAEHGVRHEWQLQRPDAKSAKKREEDQLQRREPRIFANQCALEASIREESWLPQL
jgi:hypothetical protein